MKKLLSTILCLILALSLACTFVACSDDKDEKTKPEAVETSDDAEDVKDEDEEVAEEEEEEEEEPAEEATEVEEYVALHDDEIAESLIGGMGMDGEADVYAVENIIYVDVKVTGMDNLTDEQKQAAQEAYDAVSDAEKAEMLDTIRTEISSLEGIVVEVCEEDGDYIATLEIVD